MTPPPLARPGVDRAALDTVLWFMLAAGIAGVVASCLPGRYLPEVGQTGAERAGDAWTIVWFAGFAAFGACGLATGRVLAIARFATMLAVPGALVAAAPSLRGLLDTSTPLPPADVVATTAMLCIASGPVLWCLHARHRRTAHGQGAA